MFEHSYTCNSCNRRIKLRSESIIHPMNARVGLHSSFYAELDELRAYYGISSIGSRLGAGSRNCSGTLRHNPDEMTTVVVVAAAPPQPKNAVDHSRDFAETTAGGGVVNTVCAAYDAVTGRFKKGVNAHGIRREHLHAHLRAAMDQVEQLEGWSTENCAEVQAVHKLLGTGSNIANIRVHSRSLDGQPKPPCENCQGWLTAVAGQGFKIRT